MEWEGMASEGSVSGPDKMSWIPDSRRVSWFQCPDLLEATIRWKLWRPAVSQVQNCLFHFGFLATASHS